jgi:hypothetical protein
MDKQAEWLEQMAETAARAREQDEAIRWNTSQVAGGELGCFYVGLQSESLAEAAGRDDVPALLGRLFGEEKGAKRLAHAAACLASAETMMLRDRPDLSYPAEEGAVPAALVVTRITVRPGQQDACEELLRKIAEAVPKTGDPRRFTTWQPLIGDLRTVGSVRSVGHLDELDQVLPPPELLEQAFGPAEGGLIYRAGLEAIEDIRAELCLPRPELSNPPQ